MTSKTPTFTMRDPAELRGHYHPALKILPELPDDSPEFLAISAGVKKCGIIQPLLINDQGQILDDHSRTLLRSALRWQLKAVPVCVRYEDDVHMIIIHSLAHRRHLSKSAIAYLAYPHLGPAFEYARQRKLKQIKDSEVVSAETTEATVEDLAAALGIGRNLLFEAQKVHKEFSDKKTYSFNVRGGPHDGDVVECTLKAWFEPKLLQPFVGGEHEVNRPLGLGGIMAGIAIIKEGNRDVFNPKGATQLDLFSRGLNQFFGRALKVPTAQIAKTVKSWLECKDANLSDEQLEQLEQLGETLKTEARARRKTARHSV